MSAITIENDLVHYEVLGRGRPVIFVHGWLGSWRYWVPTMQQLSVKYRTYAVDLWGFGDSGKETKRYTLKDQVQLLNDFMEKLGIAKAALVGHSLGAAVCLRFAAQYPDRAPRVALISPPLFDLGGLDDILPPPKEPVPAAKPAEPTSADTIPRNPFRNLGDTPEEILAALQARNLVNMTGIGAPKSVPAPSVTPTPTAPSISASPSATPAPAAPSVTATPGVNPAPATPGAIPAPTAPGTSVTPGATPAPAAPSTSVTPGVTPAPATPGTSATPGATPVPAAPSVTAAPPAPSASPALAVPATPKVSTTPSTPAAPTLPTGIATPILPKPATLPPPRTDAPNPLLKILVGKPSDLVTRYTDRDMPDLDKLRAEVEKTDEAVVALSVQSFNGLNLAVELQRLPSPILLLHGKDDPLISAPSDELIGRIDKNKPAGNLLALVEPGLKHFPMLEITAKFNRLLMDFFEAPDLTNLQFKDQWRRTMR